MGQILEEIVLREDTQAVGLSYGCQKTFGIDHEIGSQSLCDLLGPETFGDRHQYLFKAGLLQGIGDLWHGHRLSQHKAAGFKAAVQAAHPQVKIEQVPIMDETGCGQAGGNETGRLAWVNGKGPGPGIIACGNQELFFPEP